MRIFLNGPYSQSLSGIVHGEGDEVVEGYAGAELAIVDDMATDTQCPVVNGQWQMPVLIAQSINLTIKPTLRPDFYVSRWLDGELSPQLLLSIPLDHLMNEDLGAECRVGMGARYVQSQILDELYTPALVSFLTSMPYSGFVTLGLSLVMDTDKPFTLCTIATGLPELCLYNVVEGIKGKVSDFFSGQSTVLQESWTLSLLLSRAPYPYAMDADRAFIKGLKPDLEKHFFLLDASRYKSSCYTLSTRIGVASAWALSLAEVNRRVLRTLRAISLLGKQYRTDAASALSLVVHGLQGRGLLGD